MAETVTIADTHEATPGSVEIDPSTPTVDMSRVATAMGEMLGRALTNPNEVAAFNSGV